MPLPEITFELPASQYQLIENPGLKQGQPLDVTLDAGVLLPVVEAAAWYYVRPDPLAPQLVQVMRGMHAFSGQIKAAELSKEGDEESATLLVDCGIAPIRVTCAAQADGTLPWGVWETRYLTGFAPIAGLLDDDFSTAIGETIGVTIWNFHRLILTPNDPLFGQWHESDILYPTPMRFDRIWITARVHKRGL